MATAALWPMAVAAQTAPADPSSAQLDDVIVTAQRQEQRLQDVPVSITAVTSEELQARSVTSLSELQYSIPGLSSYDYGPGLEYIQIRGVSNSLGAPTVGIYLDEMPVTFTAQGSALDLRLIDLERIEVLRGPQATLYGEGSMGGTIRYLTRSPKLSGFNGFVEGEYSSTTDGAANTQFSGAVDVPLIEDRLGLRLVAAQENVGGYVDNATTGQADVNDVTISTIRGKLLFRPNDRLDISLLALHQESEQDNQNFGVNRRSTAGVESPNNDEYDLIQAVASYDFDGATLVASAGYVDRYTTVQYDLSPFYVPSLTAPAPFGFGLPVGFITEIPLISDTSSKAFSTDVHLSSRGDSRFGWIVGATYRDLDIEGVSAASTSPGSLPFTILASSYVQQSQSYSLYGEVSYAVTPRLRVLGGLRYYEDNRDQTSTSVSFDFPTVDNNEGTFDSLNPRLNVQYELSDTAMIYANAAKGFRSGGFNLTSAGGGVFTIPPTYAPDSIWTYEVGGKTRMFDNRLDLDLAVYRSNWTDVQSSNFVPGSAITVVTNSGQVSGWGVDFAATARPTDGLTLTATYGWNDLAYEENTADKLAGDPVDNAVRESYSASIDYRKPMASGVDGFARVDYQHAGSAQITLRNFGGQVIQRPARDLLNVRLGADFGAFEVAVFANNVFDEDAPNIIGPFGLFTENLEQRPRVVGISLRADF